MIGLYILLGVVLVLVAIIGVITAVQWLET